MSAVLEGEWTTTLQAIGEAVIGVWLMAGALQGYLPGLGHLAALWTRLMVGLAGLAIALPDLGLAFAAGPANHVHLIGGLVVAAGVLGYLRASGFKPAAE